MYDSRYDASEKKVKKQSRKYRKSKSEKSANTSREKSHQKTLPDKQLNKDTLSKYYNGII